MVANCGWIMPEPLATPVMHARTETRGTLAILEHVSVVRMALAKRRKSSIDDPTLASSGCKWEVTFSVGNGTPIIPVEEGKTSDAFTLSNLAISAQTALHARRPAGPVAQLALPEFTTTARTRPRAVFSDVRATSSGAATIRFFVKTAAARVD